ncbi:MAG: trehalose-phosphatase [Pseudomonadota bacterium]
MSSALPPLSADLALFLDFDGTLVEIAARPEAVAVAAGLPEGLQARAAERGGALAVVSGRTIAELDHFLEPFTAAAAGVHGLELRLADGTREDRTADADLTAIAAEMEALAEAHPALWIERKRGALALHYRAQTDLGPLCRAQLEPLVAAQAGLTLLAGHCIFEVKSAAVNKGTALRRLMADPPFAGKRPLFAGDDVTDEDGILAAQALGGIGLKVGDQASAADYRVASVAEFHRWLLAGL